MCVAVWPRAQLALGPSVCTALAAGARVRLCDTGRLEQTREKMLARCVNRNMKGALLTCSTISLRRIAPSPRTFTRSPWLPDLASTTTCARSRGRTVPPPPSPSRTPTSRLSIAPATKRCLCHQCRGMTHAFTDVSSSRICSADVLMTACGLATGSGNGRFRGFGRNVDFFSLNRSRCASD